MSLISVSLTTFMYLGVGGQGVGITYSYLEAAYSNLRSTKFVIVCFFL